MSVHQFVAIFCSYLKLSYHQILFVERSTVGLCIQCLATQVVFGIPMQTGQPLH